MGKPFNNDRIAALCLDSAATKHMLANDHTDDIRRCGEILVTAAASRRLIMLCGNGGSAADAQHLAAELVVRLRGGIERRAIAALALTTDSSVLTAGGNDYGFDNVFARQVEAFGGSGDVLIAISTSGTSANVVRAVEQARRSDVSVIGLLGGNGGVLRELCNASVVVPSSITARIQESHILIGHIWCEMIEEALFPELF